MTGGVFSVPDQSLLSRCIALTQSQVSVATSETTTSSSYTDLTTSGPAVTLTPGVTQNHFLGVRCNCGDGTINDGVNMSIAIAGAGAVDADATGHISSVAADRFYSMSMSIATAQSSGATHTSKYKIVTGGTGTFLTRSLVGWAA